MPFVALYVLAELITALVAIKVIGLGWTVLLFVASTMLGLALVRSQWSKIGQSLRRVRAGVADPMNTVTDTAMIAAGSVLVLVPGLLTTALGLVMLSPARALLRPLVVLIAGRRMPVVVTVGAAGRQFRRSPGGSEVIDGEVIDGEVVDPGQGPRGTLER